MKIARTGTNKERMSYRFSVGRARERLRPLEHWRQSPKITHDFALEQLTELMHGTMEQEMFTILLLNFSE